MSRGGIRGINKIFNITKLLLKSIPISTTTIMVSVTTRIFIIGPIVAKAVSGRKGSMIA